MAPKSIVGTHESNKFERVRHPVRRIMGIGAAGLLLAGGLRAVETWHALDMNATQTTAGGEVTYRKPVPIKGICSLGVTGTFKDVSSTLDLAPDLKGIPGVGGIIGGVKEWWTGDSHANVFSRTATVQGTADTQFCQMATVVDGEYNPKTHDMLVNVPQNTLYTKTAIAYSKDGTVRVPYKVTPTGANGSLPTDLIQAFLNNTSLGKGGVGGSAKNVLDQLDSDLESAAAQRAIDLVGTVCAGPVLVENMQTYEKSLEDQLEPYLQLLDPEVKVTAKIVGDDGKSAFDPAKLTLVDPGNKTLKDFLAQNDATTHTTISAEDKAATCIPLTSEQKNNSTTMAAGK